MSWAVGYDEQWQRDIGYGVPAICDHPDCDREIDRGLAHVCGNEPYGGEHGCGLYFCEEHHPHSFFPEDGELDRERHALCDRCYHDKPPFEPKPDSAQWIHHKLADWSWASWRAENPEWVEAHTPPSGERPFCDAPRNGTRIDAWHVVHKCWITVKFRGGGLTWNAHCPWIEATGTTVWPDRAFSCFKPEAAPPQMFNTEAEGE